MMLYTFIYSLSGSDRSYYVHTSIYSIFGSGRELLEAHPTSGYEYTVYHKGRKVVDLRGGTVRFSRSALLNFVNFIHRCKFKKSAHAIFLLRVHFVWKRLFTARKRSLGQDNIFTAVCVSKGGGGLPDRDPPGQRPPYAYGKGMGGTHPTGMHPFYFNVWHQNWNTWTPICLAVAFAYYKKRFVCYLFNIEINNFGIYFTNMNQWRIQDFREGTPTLKGLSANLLIDQNFRKNA